MTATTLAIIPFIIVILFIAVLRKSAIVGCLLAIFISLIIIFLSNRFELSVQRNYDLFINTLILSISAILVIIPGFYLNIILKKQGIIDGLAEWFSQVNIGLEIKVLILILGLVPAIESLTGFGVSLFLAIPIIFRLAGTGKASRLSLLCMNIMPWGTLALASSIGASIIQVSLRDLSIMTSIASLFVFLIFGLIALYVINGIKALSKYWMWATYLGLSLPILLLMNSLYLFPETAGILSGFGVILFGIILLKLKGKSRLFPKNDGLFRLAFPYILALLLIIFSRSIPFVWDFLNSTLVLRNGAIHYSPLTSPGIALFITALVLQLKQNTSIHFPTLLKQTYKPIAVLSLFLLLSQIMLISGMISSITDSIAKLSKSSLYVITPLIGSMSGFATGSNTSGNALAIAMQYGTGVNFDSGLLFAALQNSAAGYSVFASLPIIALVEAIAKTQTNKTEKDHVLLRFALKKLLLIIVVLIATFYLINILNLEYYTPSSMNLEELMNT